MGIYVVLSRTDLTGQRSAESLNMIIHMCSIRIGLHECVLAHAESTTDPISWQEYLAMLLPALYAM